MALFLLATMAWAETIDTAPLPLPAPRPGRYADTNWADGGAPIADGPRRVSERLAEDTVAEAGALSADMLDLSSLSEPNYALRIEVEDERWESLATQVGEVLVGRLQRGGHPVSRSAPTTLIVRVATAGLERRLEDRVLDVKERVGWPWALASLGGSALVIGGLVTAVNSGISGEPGLEGPTTLLLGGGLVIGGGILAARPPRAMEVRCPVFEAIVQLTVTPMSAAGALPEALSSEGRARVADALAPCTGNMKRIRAQM
ncbi:hypothetical protein LBMAG42_31130 [Deltaproteobacteria bacterium]|nr:hypothetical protein LBMAG42_31130 [Deltaproteobacteria bacterium]